MSGPKLVKNQFANVFGFHREDAVFSHIDSLSMKEGAHQDHVLELLVATDLDHSSYDAYIALTKKTHNSQYVVLPEGALIKGVSVHSSADLPADTEFGLGFLNFSDASNLPDDYIRALATRVADRDHPITGNFLNQNKHGVYIPQLLTEEAALKAKALEDGLRTERRLPTVELSERDLALMKGKGAYVFESIKLVPCIVLYRGQIPKDSVEVRIHYYL